MGFFSKIFRGNRLEMEDVDPSSEHNQEEMQKSDQKSRDKQKKNGSTEKSPFLDDSDE